ncbi:hypothetical protein RN51_03059 [Microbacterium oxydans]|uniref:Dinucleotide-utilizing enzyme n=2 Tax=Bacillati TaxID=1783272 RepID=A0A0F0KHW5_9MICO|nr:hypothetical protein [Microbacterium oxydans]KJL19715.1 hypothetical protein RN51_03059 [Microbacterium oxydans]
MNKSLTRSIGFWLLLIVSLATTAVGAWLISGQIATMTTTLLDGTATGVEVYVGQSLVVVGAGVLAAGIVGILLTLGLVAARALVPAPATAVVEAIDWTAAPEQTHAPVADSDAPLATTASDTSPAVVTATDATADSDDAAAAVTHDGARADDADESPSITR